MPSTPGSRRRWPELPPRQLLIATAKPRLLAAARRQATTGTIAGLIRGSGVWELMAARGIASTGHNVVVYWDEPGANLLNSPQGVAVDIGAEVIEPFAGDAALHCTTTPAGRFISALHVGPHGQLGETYAAILGHARAKRLALAGPYWEYYGHATDDPARLEVAVNFALRD